MDLNDIRELLVPVLLLAFVGVWMWAFSGRPRADFDAAAALPLEEDQPATDDDPEGAE